MFSSSSSDAYLCIKDDLRNSLAKTSGNDVKGKGTTIYVLKDNEISNFGYISK